MDNGHGHEKDKTFWLTQHVHPHQPTIKVNTHNRVDTNKALCSNQTRVLCMGDVIDKETGQLDNDGQRWT